MTGAIVSPAQLEQQVRPILEKCVQCHGSDLRMANLDLRTREAMLKGGDSGPALVAGHSEQSLLFRRVSGLEKSLMPMAPVAPLSAEEVALVKDWIDQGAGWTAAPPSLSYGDSSYKEKQFTGQDRNWWAFRKPVRYPVPAVSDTR